MLDTSAYSVLKLGHPEANLLVEDAEEIVFSLVVMGEQLSGFHGGRRLKENVADLASFLVSPHVSTVGITAATADCSGRISADLRRQGTPIPSNDMWIAAQAMECGAEVITLDPHFLAVPGLVVHCLARA